MRLLQKLREEALTIPVRIPEDRRVHWRGGAFEVEAPWFISERPSFAEAPASRPANAWGQGAPSITNGGPAECDSASSSSEASGKADGSSSIEAISHVYGRQAVVVSVGARRVYVPRGVLGSGPVGGT